MKTSDWAILGKKILVGVVVTIVPFIIIVGGLVLARRLLIAHDQSVTTVQKP